MRPGFTRSAAFVATTAFILSQKHEGWTVLPTLYDDGGYSGGTMERPALQRLLADIGNARVRDHYRREVKNRLFALWREKGARRGKLPGSCAG